MNSDFFKSMATQEGLISNVQKFTPEILPWSIAGNSLMKMITKTDLASLTKDKILSKMTDSDP